MEVGRGAIEKAIVGALQNWDEEPSRIEQVKLLGNDAFVAVGSWSGTWHGPDGPDHEAGRFAHSWMREGGDWKLVVHVISVAPTGPK